MLRNLLIFSSVHAGKFYELYADDAQIGHDVLNWKLTVTGTRTRTPHQLDTFQSFQCSRDEAHCWPRHARC